jgi:predicted AlkP superfamily phosphohydrolase/phosphomutase
LGNALKEWSPAILHPKIPQVLMVFGMLMAAGLLAPLSSLLPNLTFTELMLVAAGSAAGARGVHDQQKIKDLKNGGGK